jgi:uncharacterized RmlC-like cupin family protein
VVRPPAPTPIRLLLLSLVLGVAGCTAGTTAGPTTAAPAPGGSGTTVAPIVREVLNADADPPGAPGHALTLVRYTIAPGARLPAHIHPGVQVAAIESGTLSYTVVSGTATVRHKGGAEERITGPATATLEPGDAVTETGDMVHFGANQGGTPLVILAALLTESGQELTVTVPTR